MDKDFIRIIRNEQKKQFLRDDLDRSALRRLTFLEKVLANFKHSISTMDQEWKKKIFMRQHFYKDMFMKSIMRSEINEGKGPRYPIGWEDKEINYGNNNFIFDDSHLFSLWFTLPFEITVQEFEDLPLFRFSSLGKYIAFILAIFHRDYPMAENCLDLDEKNDKSIIEEVNQIIGLGNDEIFMLGSFYAYRGNAVKILQNEAMKSELKCTRGKNIKYDSHLNETLWFKKNQNFLGELLTKQRDTLTKRKNL